MTIEITSPEIEALIHQRICSGEFSDPQAVILDALRASAGTRFTGRNLVAAMQSSPHREIEIESGREQMPVRDLATSLDDFGQERET